MPEANEANDNSRTIDGRTHTYNAHAEILSGKLSVPVAQHIVPQLHAQLPEEGGYFSQRGRKYRLESVISIESSYSHVAGNRNPKRGGGWTTISTTVIEGLNVFEIVNVDRIVGQIITDHPPKGYVPKITFLGTRYENFRIAGYPIAIDLDIKMLGPKPENDAAYTHDAALLERIKGQVEITRPLGDLSEELRDRYNRLSSSLQSPQEEVECTLVKSITGNFPGTVKGNVIHVPDFGSMVLAKVTIKHEDFNQKTPKKTTFGLTMIDFHFGCGIGGSGGTGVGSSNGSTVP